MSNIPEGTQFIEAGCGEKGFRKYEKGCWWFFEGFWRHVDWKMGDLRPVTEHPLYVAPATPWSGEGLPPVGMVCEFAGYHADEAAPTGLSVGDKVTVIAHYLSGCVQVAAFTYNCAANFGALYVEQGAHGCFRPIRTPEQIAADERSKEIGDMREIVTHESLKGLGLTLHLQALYDAGYRKVTP